MYWRSQYTSCFFTHMNPNIYPWLKEEVERRITEIHPNASSEKKWVQISETYNVRYWNKYLQVFTHLETEYVHYEYLQGNVTLHLEGEFATREYLREVRELKKRSQSYSDELVWLAPESHCVSCMYREPVNGTDDMIRKFRRMAEIFEDNLVEIFEKHQSMPELCGQYYVENEFTQWSEETSELVTIDNKTITEIFDIPLVIPSYQRIYCWGNHQINSLWQCLKELERNIPYHLGNIILQKREDKYEVVDGQQRLVTLSLMLLGLGYKGALPLLVQRFIDDDAIKHVENAKAVIDALRYSNHDNSLLNKIVENLRFSVLVIHGENLDLGYTFFANQNSKGVKLSDFDLLKAHHLRYISSEPQARHLATNWARLSQVKEGDCLQIDKSIGKHIYRMRHLLRKEDFNEYGRYVRDEFKSAPLMADIPPFGERFDYFEPIQGGAHFFAFANQLNERYKTFVGLPQVLGLRDKFLPYHRVYEEMAETLLFAYYLKFNSQYLSEALFCILAKLSEHRYAKVRAIERQVQRFAIDTNLVQMLQFCTSPTFFLAAALDGVKTTILDYDITGGRRWDFYKCIYNLFSELNDITVEDIKRRIENEYA